jgi:hypothetical protein
MRRFLEINDDSDTSDARIDAIAQAFATEPFDIHAVLEDGDALIVEVTGFGIVVTIFGFVVADPRLPDETVETDLGGQPTELNRRCFVSREIAAPAVTRFLRFRDTPAELGWFPISILNEWKRPGFGGPPLSDDAIIELWVSDRRVDAVREYRRAHSLGLKEAMHAIELLVENRQRTKRRT